MNTMDVPKLNIDELFYDVKTKAVKKLEIDFRQKQIDTSSVKELWFQVDKIEKTKNIELKLKQIMKFLIDNSKHYKEGVKTPLNIFFRNCTLIIRKHLQ